MWLKFLTIFSLLTSSAWAYRLTRDFTDGFYWQSMPISITVVDKDPIRKARIESLSLASIDEWQTRSGLGLWDYVGGGTKNIIRWSTNFAGETNMDPNSVLAVAVRYTNGPYFAKTEIIINGGHTFNQDDALLRTTLTHELGHTMGLDHSEVSRAIMAPTLQTWDPKLHSDDVAGIREAYEITEFRQVTRYVSPLAFESEGEESQALSCGTIGPATASGGVGFNGLASLAGGLLISFVRKILKWFKSRL